MYTYKKSEKKYQKVACLFRSFWRIRPAAIWNRQKEDKNENYSWYSAQGPGRMAQTPQAGTGDSMSRFRRYHCSTVINYDSYFLVGEQFCLQLLFTT